MIENFGSIIKLNRQQQGLTLKYIKHKTGISKGHLSRIENNKEKISYENVKMIFDVMEIPITEEDLNNQFEKDFMAFYLDVVYLRDYTVSFEKIKSYQHYIRSSFSYIKYLLANMIYDTLNGKKNILKEYSFIKDYFYYLEPYQCQLFYDYLGIYNYLNKNPVSALKYYNLALTYQGNDYSKSMLYYHVSTSQLLLNNLQESLKYSYESRSLFSKTINLKRIVSINFEIARIYSRNGNYREAEKINLNCIQAYKELDMKINVAKTYNNLIWEYIRSKEYQKVFEYCDKALETEIFNHCIYFYMSFASYKLGDSSKAREYIKLARETMDEPTKYMETMIKAYQIYLSNANNERKEKHLLKVYEESNKINDYDLNDFILEMLCEFYKNTHNLEKELEYTLKYVEKLKSKK
ncbi:MAG: helix-turn-helix domain-containing protein [Longibaculum sp.]